MPKMPITIGIVGGLGPEGTVHYYRKMIKHFSVGMSTEDRPGIIIDHVWMDHFANLMRIGAQGKIEDLFIEALCRLRRSGADFALVAAVTPHKFLARIRDKFPLPVIDIVDATCRQLCTSGHKRVGLLGTRLTLTDLFLRKPLEKKGITVLIPDEADIAYLDKLIFGDLAAGKKTEDMRKEIADIIERLQQRATLDGLVVACTDLFDILSTDLTLVDPIDCHIRAAGQFFAEVRNK